MSPSASLATLHEKKALLPNCAVAITELAALPPLAAALVAGEDEVEERRHEDAQDGHNDKDLDER